MSNELVQSDDVSLEIQGEINIEKIRILLQMFNFNIPEEQLPYVKIEYFKKWEIAFTNSFTQERYFGFYTAQRPIYKGNPAFYGESESFLGQRIENDSVIKINWFELQGKRYIYDEMTLDSVYIPRIKGKKNLL